MNTPQDFVNWLEGFLDACKNSPTPQQIREVRKKMIALPTSKDRSTSEVYSSLWNKSIDPIPADHFSTITLVQPDVSIPNNDSINEEFIKAVEENKNASTMGELLS